MFPRYETPGLAFGEQPLSRADEFRSHSKQCLATKQNFRSCFDLTGVAIGLWSIFCLD
jgi:hypothetical protein